MSPDGPEGDLTSCFDWPALGRLDAIAVIPRAQGVSSCVIDPNTGGDVFPELDSGPLVEEAHGQGHASPVLHRARRGITPIQVPMYGT